MHFKILKSYNYNYVINNLTFDFNYGLIYAIKGKEHIGKTTVLKVISGRIKNQNTIDYNDTFNKDDCMFMQDNLTFFKYMTVGNLLDFYYHNLQFSLPYAIEMLKKFSIRNDELIRNLSNEKKKVINLIFTLSINKHVYFLDEPFKGLDSSAIPLLCDMINDVKAKDKLIIITTKEAKEDIYDGIYEIIDASNLLFKEGK